MTDLPKDLPEWLRCWCCPYCDDGDASAPCECFEIQAAMEAWRSRQPPEPVDAHVNLSVVK